MLAESGKKLDAVLDFEVPDDKLVDRISGRRIHPASYAQLPHSSMS